MNEQWADIRQSFTEDTSYAEHRWLMVRHGDDHVHIVIARVGDVCEVRQSRNDRRSAQTACTNLEKANGLEAAPRRREQVKQPVLVERENARFKTQLVAAQRAQKEREAQEAAEKAAQRAKWRDTTFSNPPTTRRPGRSLSLGKSAYSAPQAQLSRGEVPQR